MLVRPAAALSLLLFVLLSSRFVWSQTPQIAQVSPASGPSGTLVTISGSSFGASQGSVSIGGATAGVGTWNDTQITATIAGDAQVGVGTISVTTVNSTQSNAFGFTVLPPNTFPGPVTYSYDELGRLVGAVAATGDSVQYSYDAVGNILSINRYSAGQFAYFTFGPKSGPVGTSVTILGANFSANSSQDSVGFNGFNGTTAAVTSATATNLVVTVPAGATTGPLTISSPSGSITTADSFTVTNSDGKPRIDSFTPQIVAPGTAVSVAGANFGTTIANDRLIVNITSGLNPTSATATSMSMNTPSATGSGHISLNTPNGTVTSTGDLFIPASGYTVSSIASAGRTTSGVPVTVALSGSQAGMLIIDGRKGQMISAVASSSTFGSCNFYLFDPFNAAVHDSHSTSSVQASGTCNSSGGLIDSQPLPISGTYTFMVWPSTSSGHVTLTPYLFDDIQGNVTLNSSIVATTSFPGQNIRYSLFGAVNQHISISMISSTFASCTLSVLQPDGTPLISGASCSSTASFIEVPVLAQNGFYTILLDPAGAATGTLTFKVNDATDIAGTISTDGTQVTVKTTVPGQNVRLTFSGTAGQQISAKFQNVNFSNGISLTLLDPTGAQVNVVSIGPATIFMDDAKYCFLNGVGPQYLCSTVTLPTSGTYTAFLNPAGANTGQAKVSLYSVPSDATISSSLGGSQISVPLNLPGQNTKVTFSGTQNGRVGIGLSNAAFTGAISPIGFQLQVLLPNGTPLGGTSGGAVRFSPPATSGFVDINDIYTFPTTGTYTLTVDPLNDSTGTVNINLYDATDVSVATSADGTPQNISTTSPGQNAHLNFTPTVGQRISAVLSNSTYTTLPGFTLNRFDASGNVNTLVNPSTDGAKAYLETYTVTQSGNYFLLADPSSTQTGSATIALYTVTDLSGTIDPAGTPITATITTPGQNGTFTFSANSGQTVTLTTSSTNFAAGRCTITIFNPNGTSVGARDCANTGSSSWTSTQTGTFKAIIDPTQSSVGNATFSVNVQ